MTKTTTTAVHAVEESQERPWRINDQSDGDGDLYEIRVTVHSTGSTIGIFVGDSNQPPEIEFMDPAAARLMAEGLIYAADLGELIEANKKR
jgi:hypothetical protein